MEMTTTQSGEAQVEVHGLNTQRPDEDVLLRQALYRFFAGSLLYPDEKRVGILKVGASWLAENVECESLGPLLRERLMLLFEATVVHDDLTELQGAWVRLFGVSRTSYCYPYEGAHLEPENAAMLMTVLQREYAAQGLVLTTDDLPDHVGVELEYMSYLCGLEVQALRDGDDARQSQLAALQRRFLSNHLCRWLPMLTMRVEKANGGIFADILAVADLFTQVEKQRLVRPTS